MSFYLNQGLVMWQDVEDITISLSGMCKTHYALRMIVYDTYFFKKKWIFFS